MYRGEKKGVQILLSYSQAGPGRKAKQGQEEISRNHVQRLFLGSVDAKKNNELFSYFDRKVQTDQIIL